jgi:hypothetical protein
MNQCYNQSLNQVKGALDKIHDMRHALQRSEAALAESERIEIMELIGTGSFGKAREGWPGKGGLVGQGIWSGKGGLRVSGFRGSGKREGFHTFSEKCENRDFTLRVHKNRPCPLQSGPAELFLRNCFCGSDSAE